MVNIEMHRSILISILREIYTDKLLRTKLGFKGGTAAMLFYDLPRLSVDLDFDLLNIEDKQTVSDRLKNFLPSFGNVIEAYDKYYTLFFLINYQKGERNVKIEISKRKPSARYESKNYLGISMLVMEKEDMAAGKIAALVTRKRFASRDVFDLWYFLKNNWKINEGEAFNKTKMPLDELLKKSQSKVKNIKKTKLLSGLGELIDERQKDWVRDKLQDELIFLLRLYAENLKRST